MDKGVAREREGEVQEAWKNNNEWNELFRLLWSHGVVPTIELQAQMCPHLLCCSAPFLSSLVAMERNGFFSYHAAM